MRELFSLNEGIRDFEDVIIYGTGRAGKTVFLKLLQNNVRVCCFTDSDPENCGKKHLNIPIVHIGDLTDKRNAAVIVCGMYAFQVAKELQKRGFNNLFFDCVHEAGIVHLEREDEA
jgi:NADH/NAD ratio-sensing transcriptional regulator Rex